MHARVEPRPRARGGGQHRPPGRISRVWSGLFHLGRHLQHKQQPSKQMSCFKRRGQRATRPRLGPRVPYACRATTDLARAFHSIARKKRTIYCSNRRGEERGTERRANKPADVGWLTAINACWLLGIGTPRSSKTTFYLHLGGKIAHGSMSPVENNKDATAMETAATPRQHHDNTTTTPRGLGHPRHRTHLARTPPCRAHLVPTVEKEV